MKPFTSQTWLLAGLFLAIVAIAFFGPPESAAGAAVALFDPSVTGFDPFALATVGTVGLSEIKKAIDGIGEAFGVFKTSIGEQMQEIKTAQASIADRVEEIEARRGSPGKTGSGGGDGLPAGVKVFDIDGEKAYQIPSTVKVADVIKPKAPAEISLDRFLAGLVLGARCKDREAAQYAAEQKAILTTSTGVLIPESFQAELLDLIRAESTLMQAGITTVIMQAKVANYSAVTADPTVGWRSEGSSLGAANPTFAARTLSARTLAARCQASLEQMQDSPNFGAQLTRVIAGAFAAELDRAGLIGDGATEPQGLRGAPGVAQIEVGGSPQPEAYFGFIAAIRTLLDANVPLADATRDIIMSPGLWETLETEPTGLSGDRTQLARPRSLANTNFRVTSALTDTGSPSGDTAFFGRWPDLYYGTRMEASIDVLRLQSYADNLLFEIIGVLRGDYMIARPSSFATFEGVIP